MAVRAHLDHYIRWLHSSLPPRPTQERQSGGREIVLSTTVGTAWQGPCRTANEVTEPLTRNVIVLLTRKGDSECTVITL
jgi:hypothetical protein